jgi:predicted GIY-YIG superfamily endonuclease
VLRFQHRARQETAMDQISELKRSEKKQKEALFAALVLFEELIAELNLEPTKANRFKEKIRGLLLLMR